MATAFYGTMTIRYADGTILSDRFDSTDITDSYVTWASSGGGIALKAAKAGHIVDLVTNVVAAGTTLDFKLHLNQKDTGIRWVQSANFPTVDNRFLNVAPIPIAANTEIRLQVIT
ncbi:unnamed protein product [marine sediment metagenome]|uniref:Uncharacterized protein n=1 Tax=marine sediment metagenome TaxID=412755 RepID=X1AHM0_9ZZZZ